MTSTFGNEFAALIDLADRCAEQCIRDARENIPINGSCDRVQLERWKFLMRTPEVDDRDHPEFPLFNRRWPATSTSPITVAQWQVLLKDESECPTGTFKDRAAHEIILRVYRDELKIARKNGRLWAPQPLSLISAGSMAVALQHICIQLRLPDVRVLMDLNTARQDPDIIMLLQALGARVYLHALSQKELSEEDVLTITKNPNGIDVTTRSLGQILDFHYYDWCCHEILDCKPRHIFVPVGNGDLFANLISVIADLRLGKSDRRFVGGTDYLRNINVYGATTNERLTRMTKLYAPFRPALPAIKTRLAEYKREGILGAESGIYPIDDCWADEALSELRRAKPHIQTELSAVAGLALFLNCKHSIPVGERVLVVNTGRVSIPK